MQSDFKNFKWDELIKSLPVEKTEGDKEKEKPYGTGWMLIIMDIYP